MKILRDAGDSCEKAASNSSQEKINCLEYYLGGPALRDWENVCDSVGVDEEKDDITSKCRIEAFKEKVIMDQWE